MKREVFMALQRNDFEKIDRFIKGEAAETEKEYVESLFLNEENNGYLRQSIEKDWNSMLTDDSQSTVNLDHLLDRIYHTIRKNESLMNQRPIHKFIKIYSRIAAVLMIPVLIATILYYKHLYSGKLEGNNRKVETEIYAPMGSRVTFNLPDGTKGVLNGGSKLSYYLPFEEDRRVKLEGEVWFEVRHDEKHPMIVSTGISTVKVIGTSFNLNTNPNEEYIEVVLKEGKVEFAGATGKKAVTMYPSERLVFQKGKISKSVVDPSKYNAWTEGKLVFRGDPMTEVARRIERWYNVKVTIADRALEKYIFRATFQDDKVEDVFKYLSMTSPISYKISERKMQADGTIQKKEIIMYKRTR